MNIDGSKLRDAMRRQLDDLKPRVPVEQVTRRARRGRLLMAGAAFVIVALIASSSALLLTRMDTADIGPAENTNVDSRIVFTRFSQDGGIFVMNGDGSEPRRIADGDHYALDFPAWSPDGSKIAFHGFFGEAANEDGGLFVINADGSGLKLLELAGTTPTWSPDGDEIAFAKGGSLHKISPSGGPSRPVVVRQDVNLGDWSPLGDRFVFSLDGIYVVADDGGGPEKILDGKNAGHYPSRPQWSPDASRIAFTAPGDDPSQNTIDIVNADGSDRRTLTQGSSPTWSPDGTRIAFERIDGDVSHIYSIRIDGTDLQQLTSGPDSDHSPDWIGIEGENEDASPQEHSAVHTNDEAGLAITTPADWTIQWSQSPASTALYGGTYAFDRSESFCSSTGPLTTLPSDGAFFWMYEFDLPDAPVRPQGFSFDEKSFAPYEGSGCVPTYRIDFADAGRTFSVHVAFGSEATATLRDEVLDAFDSLEVRPGSFEDEPPCEDDGRDYGYGKTIPGDWLEDLLLELGAPGGHSLTGTDVRDTGTALRIDPPEYDNDPTIYATMITPGIDPNVTESRTKKEIGRVDSYTLYFDDGNPWQSYSASNGTWELSLIAYPGVGNDDISWPDGTVDWLKEAAAKAEQSPPQCEGPIT